MAVVRHIIATLPLQKAIVCHALQSDGCTRMHPFFIKTGTAYSPNKLLMAILPYLDFELSCSRDDTLVLKEYKKMTKQPAFDPRTTTSPPTPMYKTRSTLTDHTLQKNSLTLLASQSHHAALTSTATRTGTPEPPPLPSSPQSTPYRLPPPFSARPSRRTLSHCYAMLVLRLRHAQPPSTLPLRPLLH